MEHVELWGYRQQPTFPEHCAECLKPVSFHPHNNLKNWVPCPILQMRKQVQDGVDLPEVAEAPEPSVRACPPGRLQELVHTPLPVKPGSW